MMGNLKEQGFRLMVNKETEHAAWLHPAETLPGMLGYIDCTDMDDFQFMEFLAALND
jgi:hypothetical protein